VQADVRKDGIGNAPLLFFCFARSGGGTVGWLALQPPIVGCFDSISTAIFNRLVVSSEALRPQPQNRLRIMNNHQVLFDAAKDGKVGEVLRTLLAGVADINAKVGELGETPLLVACWNGHLEAAQALLLGNADVEATDDCEHTALHKACYEGHTEIVQLLVQVGANMEAKDFNNETALHKACRRGHVQIVELLLKKGADFGAIDNKGATALHVACHDEVPDGNQCTSMNNIVRMLLAKGADVGAIDGHGRTPLYIACASKKDRSKLIEILLENGANPERQHNGETPFHTACRFANLKHVQLLFERGVQLEATSNLDSTPLIKTASSFGSDEDVKKVVKFLLDKGAVVNATDYRGRAALHVACGGGKLETARLLLDHGAGLEARDQSNHTPLHHACNGDKLDVVKELVKRGAGIFARDYDGSTPFDCAKRMRASEVAEYLLEQYKGKIWEREGRLSLHAILNESTNLGDNNIHLPIGTVTVDELLALLVSIHSQDTDMIRTQDENRALPLHLACRSNAPMQVLCFLVGQDTSTLHMMDSAGSLPIHDACRGGASLEKIQFIVGKGGVGLLCARDNQCALPVHILCQSMPSVDVVKYMVKLYPISVSEKTSFGALPLMLACECSASESVLQILLTAHPEALVTMKAYYSH